MASKLGKIIADFSTSLATKLSIGDTTATLQSATDKDGVALPSGIYFFTLEGDGSNKEYIVATLSGTSLTNIKNITRQGIQTAGVVREHRIGSSVAITNFAHIKYINDLLDGTTPLDGSAPLAYDADPDLTGNNKKLATVKLVEDTAMAGGADASTTVKGITKLSTAPASATNPIAVGDNDTRVPNQGENDALAGTSGTPSSSNKFVTDDDTSKNPVASKVVRWNENAKIDPSGIEQGIRIIAFAKEAFDDGDIGVFAETSEGYSGGTDDVIVGNSSSNAYIAQGYQMPLTTKIQKFDLRVKKSGTPTNNLEIKIYSDNAGNPDTLLGTYTIKKEHVTTSYQTFTCTLDAGIAQTASTQYHIRINMVGGGNDASNFYYVEGDTTGSYTNGNVKTSADGSTWADVSGTDINFNVYYYAVVEADNDVTARNEGGVIVVASEAISAESEGTFILRGHKNGYNFDFYDDPAEATLFNYSGAYGVRGLGDVGYFIQEIFNVGNYTKLTEFSFVWTKTGSPTGNILVTIADSTGTLYSTSIPATGTAGTQTLYPNIDVRPGSEVAIKIAYSLNSAAFPNIQYSNTPFTQGRVFHNIGSGSKYSIDAAYDWTVKVANKKTSYAVGRNIYVSSTPGEYDITGKRIIGKILDQDTVSVGEKGGDLIKTETIFSGDIYENSESLFYTFKAPENAEKVEIIMQFAESSSSILKSTQQVTLYRNQKTTVTLHTEDEDTSASSYGAVITWEDRYIKFDWFGNNQQTNNVIEGYSIKATWFN